MVMTIKFFSERRPLACCWKEDFQDHKSYLLLISDISSLCCHFYF